MALETCGSCLSCLLIPLALWSIVVNILLYFPNGKALHAASYQLPNYVWYFEGICFSGVMILLLTVILITLECSVFYRCCQSESCNKTYRSFISIVLALLGVAFSGYSCIIFTLGLIQGPFCNSSSGWDYIFKDTAGGYLTDYPAWSRCTEPANIVEWNVILLSILIALSGLQLIICFLKVAAELKRTLCGTYSVFVQRITISFPVKIQGFTMKWTSGSFVGAWAKFACIQHSDFERMNTQRKEKYGLQTCSNAHIPVTSELVGFRKIFEVKYQLYIFSAILVIFRIFNMRIELIYRWVTSNLDKVIFPLHH